MSRIVDALVEAGLVTRDANPNDRRGVRIAATDTGRRVMEEGRERRVKALVARLGKASAAERRRLPQAVELLEKILE